MAQLQVLPVVTIDGASGVGKSSTAVKVAAALGVPVLNTGSIYRAAALACGIGEVDLEDADACGRVVEHTTIELVDGVAAYVNGHDVRGQLRSAFATKYSSIVSAYPRVRAALLDLQRQAVLETGGVAEGRDTGTVVFPDAHLKVYLTANLTAQISRRTEEIMASRGMRPDQVDIASVVAELEERDERDSNRALSPLSAARDAIHIDTSEISIDIVVAKIVGLVRERVA